MIWIAYAAEVVSLTVCAAFLNYTGCEVMAWVMLALSALTTVKRKDKP